MVSSATQTLRGTSGSDRWLRGLLVGAVLAVAGASGSSAAGETPSPSTENAPPAAPESGATPRPPTARTTRHHYSPGEIIDANVHRLAHGLELNPGQQTKLRGILVDHYQALTKLRTDAAPGTDRSGAMRAIVDRTRERIRSILNDAQKQKYSTDVSTELAGPSRADLEHWLEVRDAAATQAPESSAKEN
jgi:hypothetical protein